MRATCCIAECGRQAYGRGLCSMHWARWKRHGDTSWGRQSLIVQRDPADYPAPTPQATACQIWSGRLCDQGYGRVDGQARTAAHRWVWEQANGPIPPGMCVMHLCDNPPCINLAHLRLGTHADNMADKASKGRAPRGERQRSARLTEADVRLIRASDESDTAIARRYGVVHTTIRSARLGVTWRHVA